MQNKKGSKRAKEKSNPQKRLLPYAGLIFLSAIIVYYPALKNGILQWDDNLYVTDNRSINSLANIPFFFKSFFVGNYQPLTMITYSIIWHFNKTAPFLYHFVNILFHVFNSLLVFYFIYELLKDINLGLITGLLFALHPLHVESVAWIAELKDVQYAFFFFISLIFYLKFIRQRKSLYYILSVSSFLLSLLSKGQAVALFPTLLLIDYLESGKFFTRLVEKVPFLLLSLIFGVVAVVAQKSDNTIGDFTNVTFAEQIALASYSLTMYILKIVLPFNLSSFYPYPTMINGKIPGEYWACLLIIPLIIYSLITAFKKNRLIFFGLLFFVANIILLLQLLPVGNCIMADRYTYISAIGLDLIIAYLFLKYINSKKQKLALISLLAVYLIFLSVKSYSQVTIWKNDFTLWNNVLSIYPDISSALVLRGCAYNDKEEYEKALADFNHSIELDSKNGLAYFNRGVSKSKLGDFTGALKDYETADKLKIEKRHLFNFYVSWGGALANTGKINEAMQLFDKAIALDSLNASVYNNRGITKAMMGNMNGALDDFNRAVKLKPDFDEAINNRNKAIQSTAKK